MNPCRLGLPLSPVPLPTCLGSVLELTSGETLLPVATRGCLSGSGLLSSLESCVLNCVRIFASTGSSSCVLNCVISLYWPAARCAVSSDFVLFLVVTASIWCSTQRVIIDFLWSSMKPYPCAGGGAARLLCRAVFGMAPAAAAAAAPAAAVGGGAARDSPLGPSIHVSWRVLILCASAIRDREKRGPSTHCSWPPGDFSPPAPGAE